MKTPDDLSELRCLGVAVAALLLLTPLFMPVAQAAGTIWGNADGYEREVAAYGPDGRVRAWTITGANGLYEFNGLEAGVYMMKLHDNIVPFIEVSDNRATTVDYASQLALSTEFEVWTPARVRFAQSFMAAGTAVLKLSLWRATGKGRLAISLFEESPGGRRVAGPWLTQKEMAWACTTYLPEEQFKTTPGRQYALEIEDAEGEPWRIGMPRLGDVHPDGIAWFDGVPHPESDLGITLEQARPGPIVVARADWDLHFIAEGPGSGFCRVAGQTFSASTPNVIRTYANCGWSGPPQDFLFSIHEDGPGGARVGPECRLRMVPNWGSHAVWAPNEIRLQIGKRYFLQYRRADDEPFFSYLSKNLYRHGRAYRDGTELPEQFDQWFEIIGEEAPGAITFPYDVRTRGTTRTSTTVCWRTGTPSDSLVHYGLPSGPQRQAGTEAGRSTDHAVELTGLVPGTAYAYRVSGDTHKAGSRRTCSRTYYFLTQPDGEDRPRYDVAPSTPEVPACGDCVPLRNASFEEGLTGWKRLSRIGRPSKPESFISKAEPFGDVTGGMDGYTPHGGRHAYGWSWLAASDPLWRDPREDWKQEIICQKIEVQPDLEYVFSAWLLTGDQGRSWGRDSRIRLAVDEEGAGLLDGFETVEQAHVTQWFATLGNWRQVSLRFRPRTTNVAIGVNLLQWWALKASYLYVDDVSVRPAR